MEEQIIRIIGAGRTGDLFRGVNGEALAAIGIDLDTVRERIGAAFGPGALERDVQVVRGRGLLRRHRRLRVRRAGGPPRGPRAARPHSVHSPGQEMPGAQPARGPVRPELLVVNGRSVEDILRLGGAVLASIDGFRSLG